MLSTAVPGLGQVLSGCFVKGLLWFGCAVAGLLVTLWLAASPSVLGLRAAMASLSCSLALWVLMLVDAYRSVRKPEERELNKPWIAAFLSSMLPGLGQIYSRQFLRGLAVWVGLVCLGFLPEILGLVGVRLLWIGAVLDAYHGARRRTVAPQNRIGLLAAALIMDLVFSAGAAFGIRAFAVQPFKVPTAGMSPTLRGAAKLPDGRKTVGDHIFVDKLTYRVRAPKRGEIVVFRTDNIQSIPAQSRGQYWVKRIVGLPGERVSIKPPFVYVNGQKLTSPKIFQEIQSHEHGYEGYILPGIYPPADFLRSETDAIQLGSDEYLVLGDNSPRSLDGRFWGALARRNIVGRVTKVYWPLERMGITFNEESLEAH
jgi:signal peptidase I